MNLNYGSSLVLCGAFVWGCTLNAAEQTEEATEPVTPQLVERQLRDAESEFDEAKKMFNPWYTGPLLTPSAHVLPPGDVNIQVYYFLTDNFAAYNRHGKAKKIPHLIQNNPQAFVLVGITDWLDFYTVPGCLFNNQAGQHAVHFSDLPVALGFQLMAEKPYRPALLLGIQELFPTGKYQKFDPEKGSVDSTGGGSYQTKVSLNISKVVWWVTKHPMNIRGSANYTIPANAHVRGFNSYGGGFGTAGTVKPGKNLALDIGYEYSFTQRWVAALDVAYTYSAKTTFKGTPGVTALGTHAAVGGPFNEQLSLAPALEYNPTANLGFIAGCWFTVWGKNSLDFVSGIASVTYTF